MSAAAAGSATASAGDSTWHAAVRDWSQRDGPAWVFVAKTLIAAFLALWIGFRLDLDGARSAMLTVIIVSQPHSGNVIAKSFYRVLGTVVGLLVTIGMVQWFSQTRDLYIIAACLWVGLCVAGAAYFRNFQSYGFLLAGYTSCLIGFPAAEHPEATFDIALSRASTVLLGILCTGFVAEILLPQRLSDLMVTTVRRRYRDFADFIRKALTRQLDHAAIQQAHNRFTADVLMLDTQRAAAYFESPEMRLRDERLRLFNAEFMAASTSFHALHQWMERMRREKRDAVVAHVTPAYLLIDAAMRFESRIPAMAAEARIVGKQLCAMRSQLVQTLDESRLALREQDLADYDCAVDLLLRFHRTLTEYTEAYGSLADIGLSTPRPAPRLLPHTDPLAAVLMGLRASATLAILCWFWIATSWPSGGGVATIATVVCALFAQSPAPLVASFQMLLGFLLGFLAAFICAFALLPSADGFPLLVAAMAPFLMASTYSTTFPKIAGIGTGFNLMVLVELAPDNATRAGALGLINDGLAQLLGVAVAGLAFSTLIPAGSRLLRNRKLAALRAQVESAATDPLDGLGHRIESRSRDLLLSLLAGADTQRGEDRELVATALSVLEVSDAMIVAREQVRAAGLDIVSRHDLRNTGRALTRYFARPGREALNHTIEVVSHTSQHIDSLCDNDLRSTEELNALRALQRNLYRLRRALLDPDTAAAVPEASAIEGASHAT
jgi:uncharacterized membrane protein YccC